jgi:hypothetical protein
MLVAGVLQSGFKFVTGSYKLATDLLHAVSNLLQTCYRHVVNQLHTVTILLHTLTSVCSGVAKFFGGGGIFYFFGGGFNNL